MLLRQNAYLKNNNSISKKQKQSKKTKRTHFDQFVLSGGRASISNVRATVFGSTGNVGRIVVERFGLVGSQVIVPFRGVEKKIDPLKTMGELGSIVPLKWDIKDLDSIRECVQYSNLVINCTGSRHESYHFSFEDVHVDGPRMMAMAAKEVGAQFVHISALGADLNSNSAWLRSKALGEQAVMEANPDSIIIRPAPYYHHNDILNRSFATMFKYWPVFVLMQPKKLIQPVDMTNVVDAIVNASVSASAPGHIFEIAGDEVYSIEEMVGFIQQQLDFNDRKIIKLPPLLEIVLLKMLRMMKFSTRNLRMTLDEYFDHSPKVLSGKHLGLRDLNIEPLSYKETSFSYIQAWRKPQRWDDLRPEDYHTYDELGTQSQIDKKTEHLLLEMMEDFVTPEEKSQLQKEGKWKINQQPEPALPSSLDRLK